MSLLEEVHFHAHESYLDIGHASDQESNFGMAVFGLGAASLAHEVQVEMQQALILPDSEQ